MDGNPVLGALADRRHFVLAQLIRRDDGRVDKVPVDPHGGHAINAQDPKNWLYPATAADAAAAWNYATGSNAYGVGVVLFKGCGLFALDLDHARDANGGWLPHVANFCARFPGAALEVSQSGDGLHLFCSYQGDAPAHSNKNATYKIEAYTESRFIYLTGREASGDIRIDCTAAVRAFLIEFFPPRDTRALPAWTDKPLNPAWRGPHDPDEIIRRACRATSLRAVFGGAVPFVALHDAHNHVDVLARAFPPQGAGKAYDASSADLAYFNHLGWWTGYNPALMMDIAARSGLHREKWDQRPDYLQETILRACEDPRSCYIDRELSVAVPAPLAIAAAGLIKPGELPPPGTYITTEMGRQLFDGYTYVKELHAIQAPDGLTADSKRFDVAFGGRQWMMTIDGQKPGKSAWDFFTANEVSDFPRVAYQYFDPSQPCGTIRVRDGQREVNSYTPAHVVRRQGDAWPFLELVQKMLPGGNDAAILLNYMASAVQHPGIKFKWSPFIQGVKGNGKTTLAEVMQYSMSIRYTHWARADQLDEKFNSVLCNKLFVIIDEMHTDDAQALQELLKQMVTQGRIEVRPMYAEKVMKDVCYNLLLISNHKNAVRVDGNERRYAPLYCAQQSKRDLARDGMTDDYFLGLRSWFNDQDGWAIVADYLATMPLDAQLDPAGRAIRAPTTTSTQEAALSSMGGVEQEILESVAQCHEGFRNGWLSSMAVDVLLSRMGRLRSITRVSRRAIIEGMGYLPHPSLPDGFLPLPLPDGSRPHLYVTEGHPWAVAHLTPEQVRAAYLAAQAAT